MELVPSPKFHCHWVGDCVLKSVKMSCAWVPLELKAETGCKSMPTVRGKEAGELPQTLLAVTMMDPPAVPAVAEMVLVRLLPDHPEGKVQV